MSGTLNSSTETKMQKSRRSDAVPWRPSVSLALPGTDWKLSRAHPGPIEPLNLKLDVARVQGWWIPDERQTAYKGERLHYRGIGASCQCGLWERPNSDRPSFWHRRDLYLILNKQPQLRAEWDDEALLHKYKHGSLHLTSVLWSIVYIQLEIRTCTSQSEG